jgi:hypothetical protein
MTPNSATAEAAGLDRFIRVRHPDFAEWDAQSAWLAASAFRRRDQ